jgi:hypothetical protein
MKFFPRITVHPSSHSDKIFVLMEPSSPKPARPTALPMAEPRVMNMKTFALALSLTCSAAHAGPRTSANYIIATDHTGSGGSRVTSGAYTHDGGFAEVSGISTAAAPAETAKHGYVGQLYDTTGLTLTSATADVNEAATLQLSVWLALDDATFLSVPSASVAWGVQSGPLTINGTGLATGGSVYQNTAAVALGTHLGFSGTLNLTVVNTLLDNFGSYASDGIHDDWQVQYFGLNNGQAAAAMDADFDGQNNLFEFTAGLDPTNTTSRFLLENAAVPGAPTQMKITISPRLPDRSYTVLSSTTLGAGAVWSALTSFSITDDGTTRTITDLNATGAAKFYRVQILKP